MKLLLVEDDIEISQMLKSYLEAENYEVICAVDGEEACEKFEKESYSLVLLDLMIPKISGMEVMQHIRTHSTVPIIIVSAKDTDADKTLGLGLGADDYITKPFSVTEVLARIKANIRRSTQYSKPEEQEVLMMGDRSSQTMAAYLFLRQKGQGPQFLILRKHRQTGSPAARQKHPVP